MGAVNLPPLAPTVVEAAIARVIGIPRDENPFCTIHGAEQHAVWRWGWKYADELLERAIAEEARRGFEEEAA